MTVLHRRLRNILVALGAGIGVACVPGPTGPPTPTVLTLTLGATAVPPGDTVAGEAIATASYGLVQLTVTVIDGGVTSVVDQGMAANATRLDAKFRYTLMHAVAGDYVRFRAVALSFAGDSAVAVDSVHVTP